MTDIGRTLRASSLGELRAFLQTVQDMPDGARVEVRAGLARWRGGAPLREIHALDDDGQATSVKR